MKNTRILIGLILIVLLLDQWLKFYIKLNFSIGEGFKILGFDWARIHFIENEGMAFGILLGGVTGKYVLSIFRILMVGFLIYLLRSMVRTRESFGLQISFALIIAGALGNILDSAFYGLIFSESGYHSPIPAVLFPEEGGYAPFLQGKVVDMFYFPLIDGYFPDWVPLFGGDRFQFFRPVFNVADSAISVGVALILIFYRSYFISGDKSKNQETETGSTDSISEEE
ncbi:MAG: lipoprotein signal peptidase [Saprospiraceae bacterium]|nr:lipoprotein signal peptidase [Bacteroidia bacterium]NNK89382.1 lipoprotein signal peptidase [Saprospiraceae bacterium]